LYIFSLSIAEGKIPPNKLSLLAPVPVVSMDEKKEAWLTIASL